MQPHDTDFAADVADAYARWLVPMLFEPYADDMATRIAATA